MKISFDYTLPDGRLIFVDCEMNSPETDVGIMGWWADSVYAEDGNGVQVELNDAEDEAVCIRASEIAADRDSDDY